MDKRIDLPLDANGSLVKFRELLDQPLVLFVVLGNTPEAGTLTADAVTQAGDDNDPITVVWARNHHSIATEVDNLTGQKPDMASPDKAFTASSRKVTCVIKAQEAPPDLVRIFSCMMTGLQDDGGA